MTDGYIGNPSLRFATSACGRTVVSWAFVLPSVAAGRCGKTDGTFRPWPPSSPQTHWRGVTVITTTPMPIVEGVTHHMVEAGGLNFHVAEVGDGSPVLMLHGFPQHWYAWRKVIPLLPGCRLICPDLRGFGWSDAPRRGYDVSTLTA